MRRPSGIVAFTCVLALGGCHAGSATLPPVPATHDVPSSTSNIKLVLTIPTGALDPSGLQGIVASNWYATPKLVARVSGDVSKTSKHCTSSASARTCTIAFAVKAGGPYQLAVDLANVKPQGEVIPNGSEIGGGVLPVTVRPGKTTTVALTTQATMSRAKILAGPASMPEIDPGHAVLIVTAYDAKGNAVVSNGFGRKASIAIASDPGSRPAFALAPTSITAPANATVLAAYSSSKPSQAQMQKGFVAIFKATPSVSTSLPAKTTLALLPPHVVEKSTSAAFPLRIVVAENQTLFFNGYNGGQVGNATTALATVKTYAGFNHPQTMALGPDGRIWVADQDGNSYLHAIDPSKKTVASYKLLVNTYPAGISAGPNGNVWFGSVQNNYVSYITPGGSVGPPYPLETASSYPIFSAMAEDGNEYFVLEGIGQIVKVLPNGVRQNYYTVPGTKPDVQDIIAGADGALYFTDVRNHVVFRMTTAGKFTTYKVKAALTPVGPLAFGPDGKLWFTTSAGSVARLDLATKATIAFGVKSGTPSGIVLGPDGAFYLTDPIANVIARMQ